MSSAASLSNPKKHRSMARAALASDPKNLTSMADPKKKPKSMATAASSSDPKKKPKSMARAGSSVDPKKRRSMTVRESMATAAALSSDRPKKKNKPKLDRNKRRSMTKKCKSTASVTDEHKSMAIAADLIECKPMSNWSDLPLELVNTISESLTTISDYLSLRAVCSAWRSALSLSPRRRLPIQSPWLCFPSVEGDDDSMFFPRPNSKACCLSLPEYREFLGSSHGRLIFKSKHGNAITIFNPLTRSGINLPIFDFTFDFIFDTIYKVVISPPPDPFALVISDRLLFYRPAHASWTVVQIAHPIHDAVFHNGRFYAVDGYSNMFTYHVDGSLIESFNVMGHWRHGWFYLVECEGDLMLACKHCRGVTLNDVMSDGFEVVRLETEICYAGKSWKKDRLKSLGDRVMFLGSNQGIMLSEDVCPGFKRNCIYFLDEFTSQKVGVFEVSDGRFYFLPYCFDDLPYCFDDQVFRENQTASWFTPSLC